MPLPKPKEDETQDDFISRCMGNETMKEDFPDNDQRLAVCFKQWKEKNKDNIGMNELERRFYPFSEIRADDTDKKLLGYAALFNSLSEEMWGFRETISPGAFIETIKHDDIRMLWNHDPNFVIARTTNGTLKLREDEKGLFFEATPADTQWEKDLIIKIKRRDITQNSFGFLIESEQWDKEEKTRTLKKVRLFDISPVTYPAYKDTEIHVRSKFGNMKFKADSLKLMNQIEKQEEVEEKKDKTVLVVKGLRSVHLVSEPDPIAIIGPDTNSKPQFVSSEHHLINPETLDRIRKKILGGNKP